MKKDKIWQSGIIKNAKMRYLDGEEAWLSIEKYPNKQSVYDSAFLGGDFTPEVGKNYPEYLEVYHHALNNRKFRILYLEEYIQNTYYSCLVLIHGEAEYSKSEVSLMMYEVKCTPSKTGDVRQELIKMGNILLSHSKPHEN